MSGFSANAFFLSSREGHDYLNYFTMKLPVFIMESCNCDTFFFLLSFFLLFLSFLCMCVPHHRSLGNRLSKGGHQVLLTCAATLLRTVQTKAS